MYVSTLRALITSHVKDMHFVSLYNIILAIDKLNGHDLSNNVCHERLPKKTKVMQY